MNAFLCNEIRPAERGVRPRLLQVLFWTFGLLGRKLHDRHYGRSPRRFAHSTSALLSAIAIRYEPQLSLRKWAYRTGRPVMPFSK